MFGLQPIFALTEDHTTEGSIYLTLPGWPEARERKVKYF